MLLWLQILSWILWLHVCSMATYIVLNIANYATYIVFNIDTTYIVFGRLTYAKWLWKAPLNCSGYFGLSTWCSLTSQQAKELFNGGGVLHTKWVIQSVLQTISTSIVCSAQNHVFGVSHRQISLNFFMLELCSFHFDYLICKTSMAIGEKWEMDAL